MTLIKMIQSLRQEWSKTKLRVGGNIAKSYETLSYVFLLFYHRGLKNLFSVQKEYALAY